MLTLALYRFNDDAVLAELRRHDTEGRLHLTKESCFWVGSTCRNSPQAARFLELLQSGDWQELTGLSDIDAGMLFALLVQGTEGDNVFHIVAFELEEGALSPPRLIAARRLDEPVNVVPKEEIPLPPELEPKIRFRSVMKEWLFPTGRKGISKQQD